MPDDTPLPDLQEGDLDAAVLAALFTDLEHEVTVLEVRVKGGAEVMADAGSIDLVGARGLLEAGRVRAVQVRYRHRDVVWIDTLIRLGERVRLIRVAAPV